MNKFVRRIGFLNTTFDYARGIKICANSEICHIKRNKEKINKPRKSMGRSLALRRSTNRGR